MPDNSEQQKLSSRQLSSFFDKNFPAPTDEEFKESFEEAFKKQPSGIPDYTKTLKLTQNPFNTNSITYKPIKDEEGLFYSMDISDKSYIWNVVDKEDGSNYKYIGNAMIYSLKDVIKKFKEEFYGIKK